MERSNAYSVVVGSQISLFIWHHWTAHWTYTVWLELIGTIAISAAVVWVLEKVVKKFDWNR